MLHAAVLVLASDAALDVCERLRQAVAVHPWAKVAPRLAVTISVGLASRTASSNAQALIKLADRALYRAKRLGRNRVQMA